MVKKKKVNVQPDFITLVVTITRQNSLKATPHPTTRTEYYNILVNTYHCPRRCSTRHSRRGDPVGIDKDVRTVRRKNKTTIMIESCLYMRPIVNNICLQTSTAL